MGSTLRWKRAAISKKQSLTPISDLQVKKQVATPVEDGSGVNAFWIPPLIVDR
jgi:hypothetical protein